jgi:ferritin-like protein
MALDMRALYYIVLQNVANGSLDAQREEENAKANENCLNQNFTILAQKLEELDERLTLLGG